MKRRNFLRLCATAIAAPVALLKGKPKPVPGFPTYAEQPYMAWKNYYAEYKYDPELLKKFREAFKNTKFQLPIYLQGIPIVYRSPLYDETIQETE